MNVTQENPELTKLQKVLSAMSVRCKEAIPNGNPNEFLTEVGESLIDPKKEFLKWSLQDNKTQENLLNSLNI